MTQETLESRVARLEQQVGKLLEQSPTNASAPSTSQQPMPHDWKRTVGMFRDDAIFKEMVDEATRMRERERRRTYEESEQDSV